jgi:hypothetical protein
LTEHPQMKPLTATCGERVVYGKAAMRTYLVE